MSNPAQASAVSAAAGDPKSPHRVSPEFDHLRHEICAALLEISNDKLPVHRQFVEAIDQALRRGAFQAGLGREPAGPRHASDFHG